MRRFACVILLGCSTDTFNGGDATTDASDETIVDESGADADGSEGGVGDAAKSHKTVFVTSTLYKSGFGGITAANALCMQAAADASLTGTFVAWLSDANTAAQSFVVHANVPYALVDGTGVAANYAGLTSGTLLHAIDKTEHNQPPMTTGSSTCTGAFVWTGTTPTGASNGSLASEFCSNWSSNGGTAVAGYGGYASATSNSWTQACNSLDCTNQVGALYCIEQ